jgi:hypothetical protein
MGGKGAHNLCMHTHTHTGAHKSDGASTTAGTMRMWVFTARAALPALSTFHRHRLCTLPTAAPTGVGG